MNAARKKRLEKAIEIVDAVSFDEQNARDNLPDGIYEGEQGDKMDEAIMLLEDIKGQLVEVIA